MGELEDPQQEEKVMPEKSASSKKCSSYETQENKTSWKFFVIGVTLGNLLNLLIRKHTKIDERWIDTVSIACSCLLRQKESCRNQRFCSLFADNTK